MLRTLIVLFVILSLLMAPAMYYYRYGGYEGYGTSSPDSYQGFSLGNMGYSSMQCSNIPRSVSYSASCTYGSVGAIKAYGINPTGKQSSTCIENDDNKVCKPFLPDDILTTLTTQCIGKNNCKVNLDQIKLKDGASAECSSTDAVFFM